MDNFNFNANTPYSVDGKRGALFGVALAAAYSAAYLVGLALFT